MQISLAGALLLALCMLSIGGSELRPSCLGSAHHRTGSRRYGPNNYLAVRAGTVVHRYHPGPEADTSGVSASGRASGRIVFVGYGLRAPEAGHDDYAGVSVRGRIVLVLDGYPGSNPRSLLARGSDIRSKAALARSLGAIALIQVLTKADFKRGVQSELKEKRVAVLPILRIYSTIAETWIREANGQGLPEIWDRADAGRRVTMLLHARASLTADLR
jgi:hypothetical protein